MNRRVIKDDDYKLEKASVEENEPFIEENIISNE
jgi:hypothetical protein